MTLLADSSAVLSASLDYETTLKSVAQMIVLDFADWCRIDLVDESGEVKMVAVAHVDPDKVAWVYSHQQKYPPNRESGQGVYQVIRTGQTEFYPEIPDALLAASAHDDDELRILREIGFTSAMVVPITVRGLILGAATFVSAESGRRYTADDLTFAEEIALRSGLAVDNARLYAASRQAAALEERQRLSRDLHDAVSQTLFSANLLAQTAANMWTTKPERVPEWLDQLRRLNQGAMAEMRTLLLQLRPEGVRTSALGDLLRQLADAALARREISVSLEVDLVQELPSDVHETFYRIAQEALNNVTKHSSATTVEITLREEDDRTVLRVSDNGQGFEAGSISKGFGLNIMQERADAVGAALTMTSQPGQGTEVALSWAFPPDRPNE